MGEPIEKLAVTYAQPVMPKLVHGEVLLGRSTSQDFDIEDFLGSSVLLKLSNQNVVGNVRGKATTVRKKTRYEDVIRTVLGVTHASLDANTSRELNQLVDTMLTEVEQGIIDLQDRGVIEAIDARLPKIADTDLMRGMAVFSEAEYAHHQGTYEATIVLPATRLAGWMVFNETEVRFA